MNMVTAAEVIGINDGIGQIFGSNNHVLNLDSLESAIGRLTAPFPTDYECAAAMFRSLIMNHPFSDGNKRTACITLLYVLPLEITDAELGQLTLDVAIHQLIDVQEIANKLYPISYC